MLVPCRSESLRTGFLLSQGGEFAFVLLSLACQVSGDTLARACTDLCSARTWRACARHLNMLGALQPCTCSAHGLYLSLCLQVLTATVLCLCLCLCLPAALCDRIIKLAGTPSPPPRTYPPPTVEAAA